MSRVWCRSLAVVPVVLGLGLAAGPVAARPVAFYVADFSGGFTSRCTMPFTSEGPSDGPYSCVHTATSVGCAAVVDSAATGATVKLCRADLTSGSTVGSASVLRPGVAAWRCDNGAGGGTFRYQPSASDPAHSFGVNLVMIGGDLHISGSYVEAGTGRVVVVRARIPAVCAANTTSPAGYAGTITPI